MKRCVATKERIDTNARLARKLGKLRAEAGKQEHEITQAASQAQLGARTSSAATCDGSSVQRALVVGDCVPDSTRRILELGPSNNLAPPFAILFMHSLETHLLAESPVLPVLYKRYIDDVIILWTHGEKRLLVLIQHFNAGHDRLKFTYELSSSKGWIDYMDVTIAIQQSGQMTYKLCQKPCNSGLLIDYASAVPHHIKLAVAKSQFLRGQRLPSNDTRCEESEQKRPTSTQLLSREPHHLRKHVIYRLQCKLCRVKYIGETGHTLETRLKEHNVEARRWTVEKPLGDHM